MKWDLMAKISKQVTKKNKGMPSSYKAQKHLVAELEKRQAQVAETKKKLDLFRSTLETPSPTRPHVVTRLFMTFHDTPGRKQDSRRQRAYSKR